MTRLIQIVAAPILISLCLAAPAATPDQENRIQNVEHGLRPAQALTGAAVPLTTIEGEMRRLHVPGMSVAVIDQSRLAWAKGYGVVTPGGAAVTPETLFQAASISKPVVAFGAMTMVQSGQLDLQADVNSYLRGWELPGNAGSGYVSPLQLLSHTGGVNVSGFPGYAAGAPLPTLLQVLNGTAPANTEPVRVVSPPGRTWRYSGGGYTVLQQMMTNLSGQAFETFMQSHVLKPMGMAASRFNQPADAVTLAHAAFPHDSAGHPYVGGPFTYPELAAAGMWTTPSDLARFALGVQASATGTGGLLDRQHAQKMLTPVLNGYALGFEMAGSGAATSFAHGGSNQGYQNYLFGYVDSGRGAVVMTNGDAGDEVARATMRSIASEYGWPSNQTRMRKALTISQKMARQMVGKYTIEGLGDFEITQRDGIPVFWIKAGQGEPLYRQDTTHFFVLSQTLALQFDALLGGSGRIVSGPFDLQFKRVR